MKKKLLLIVAVFTCLIGNINAQAPPWQWAKSAGGTAIDYGKSCTTDANGNIIATGFFYSTTITFGTTVLTNAGGGWDDIFIVKYDPIGNVLWAKSAGGTDQDEGTGCTTDASGNIIVTGSFRSSTITFGTTVLTNAFTGNADMFIVKYDSSGNVLWAKSEGGTSGDGGGRCSTDTSGNIFVTGGFSSSTITFGTTVLTNAGGGWADMFIVKYDSSGNVLWAKSAGGTSGDGGGSCSTDASGNIIAEGNFQSSIITFGTTVLTNAGSQNIFIVKYDPNGNVLWAKSEGGTASDAGYSCSTDASGNIIATGYFNSLTITFGTTVLTNAGNQDMFIVKYDSSGNVLWAKSAGGTNQEWGIGCSTDGSGNIIAAGFFYTPTITIGTTVLTSAGLRDIFIVKYDTSGNVLWAISAGGTNQEDYAFCASDASGNIIVTGRFQSPTITFGTTMITNAGGYDFYIAKLDTLSIPTGNNDVANKGSGGFVFPNPATNYIAIAFASSYKNVEVTITDITGKIIYATAATDKQKIEVNTKDFAEGIYVVQIQTEDFIETKKLIVVK